MGENGGGETDREKVSKMLAPRGLGTCQNFVRIRCTVEEAGVWAETGTVDWELE